MNQRASSECADVETRGALKSTEIFLRLRLVAVERLADRISCFQLQSEGGVPLPTWQAGAHIDLHLPGGLIRSYSLVPCARSGSYRIAVQYERDSRGGSVWLHERARIGHMLRISQPRNLFDLEEGDHPNVLVAGGIGITPIWSMIHRLEQLRRDWRLLYRARNRASAAYLDDLKVYGNRVMLSFSDDPMTPRPDLHEVVAIAAPDSHFYCCGPTALVEAFEQACSSLPAKQVHREFFCAEAAAVSTKPCRIVLARSGLELKVNGGETILSAVRKLGIDVPTSCEQGICGACEVRILRGEAEHRDKILSPAEKASQTSMMICCSGALTSELELEL